MLWSLSVCQSDSNSIFEGDCGQNSKRILIFIETVLSFSCMNTEDNKCIIWAIWLFLEALFMKADSSQDCKGLAHILDCQKMIIVVIVRHIF